METFYCVRVVLSKEGAKDLSADYYYKDIKKAEGHLQSYRDSENYVFDKVWDNGNDIMLNDRNRHTKAHITLCDCYFED